MSASNHDDLNPDLGSKLLNESRFRASESIRFIGRGQPYEAEQWARLAATAAQDYLMLRYAEARNEEIAARRS